MEIDLRSRVARLAFDPDIHYWGRPCLYGHQNENGETWRAKNGRACVLCKREKAIAWKQANPERAAANTARRDKAKHGRSHAKNRRERWPFALYRGFVARRCRDKGIFIDITTDDLRALWERQGGRCYWTGAALDFHHEGPRGALRPSLDRLEPVNGYTVGNVVWASNFANRARGDTPVEQFKALLAELGVRRGLY